MLENSVAMESLNEARESEGAVKEPDQLVVPGEQPSMNSKSLSDKGENNEVFNKFKFQTMLAMQIRYHEVTSL